MKNEPLHAPSSIQDTPHYFAWFYKRERTSKPHEGVRTAGAPIDIYACEPKPCLNFVQLTDMDMRKADWGLYTPLDLLKRMTEHDKYELFKYLSELKLSYSVGTFFDELLKEGLSKLVGEDVDKFFKPVDKKAEFEKLALELYPKYFCDAHGYLMDSLGRKIE